jgi:hypothetical protein
MKASNIEKSKRILDNMKPELRALCEEVLIIVGKAEESRILARHRLGQLVDIADDVAKYGVRAVSQVAVLFRVTETTLRKAQKIARCWSRNDLEAAIRYDPMLRLDHVEILSDVHGRNKWLQRVKMSSMSTRELRREFRGSVKPAVGVGRKINPVMLADRALSLAKDLERACSEEMSYEQADALSKTLGETALKLLALSSQTSKRLLRQAG